MAFVAVIVVFAGFSPTYYMRSSELPPLSLLLRVHGVIFTAWIVLFLAQASLITVQRADIHRRLGILGATLAPFMVVIGTMASLDSFRRGVSGPGFDPRTLLSIPLGSIFVFAVLVAVGVALRRQVEAHKRYMLLATINLLSPAIGRLLLMSDAPVALLFPITSLLVGALILHDMVSRGRAHPASVHGALLIVLFKPLLTVAANTPLWFAFTELLR